MNGAHGAAPGEVGVAVGRFLMWDDGRRCDPAVWAGRRLRPGPTG